MKEDDRVVHAICRSQHAAAVLRRERGEHTSAAAMKSTDVARYRRTKRGDAVGLRVPTEIGVIRREPADAGSLCGDLAEATDHELGRAVNDVRFEMSDNIGAAPIERRREAN